MSKTLSKCFAKFCNLLLIVKSTIFDLVLIKKPAIKFGSTLITKRISRAFVICFSFLTNVFFCDLLRTLLFLYWNTGMFCD